MGTQIEGRGRVVKTFMGQLIDANKKLGDDVEYKNELHEKSNDIVDNFIKSMTSNGITSDEMLSDPMGLAANPNIIKALRQVEGNLRNTVNGGGISRNKLKDIGLSLLQMWKDNKSIRENENLRTIANVLIMVMSEYMKKRKPDKATKEIFNELKEIFYDPKMKLNNKQSRKLRKKLFKNKKRRI